MHAFKVILSGLLIWLAVHPARADDSADVGADATASAAPARRFYRWLQENDRARMTAEASGVLLTGLGLYQAFIDLSREDFDYDASLDGLRAKYGDLEGVRFDDNAFLINMGHVPQGAWIYQIARVNDRSILEAYLVATAGSFVWEMGIETREVLSINDSFTTPLGGAAVGEALFQLGEYFHARPDSLSNDVLAGSFGHVRAMDSWIFQRKPKRNRDRATRSSSSESHLDFTLSSGMGSTTRGQTTGQGTEVEVGIRSELVTVPEYDRAERVSGRFLVDGNFTRLDLRSAFGSSGLNEFVFFARAAVAGYYRQAIHLDDERRLNGYSLYIGTATSFDLSLQRVPGAMDQLGVVNVIGPTIDTVFHLRGVRVRVAIDTFGALATIRSHAFEEWTRRHLEAIDSETGEVRGVKSILAKHENYYAYGVTGTGRLILSCGDVDAAAEISVDALESFDGRDRFESTLTDDPHLSDRRRRVAFWSAYRLPDSRWRLGVRIEDVYRAGAMRDVRVDRGDRRAMGYTAYEF